MRLLSLDTWSSWLSNSFPWFRAFSDGAGTDDFDLQSETYFHQARVALWEFAQQKRSIPAESIKRFSVEDSQCLIDFLNKVLENQNGLNCNQFKRILYMFYRVATVAQVFPARLELKEVGFNFGMPQTEGAFGSVYKGHFGSDTVSVKMSRMVSQGDNTKYFRVQAAELCFLAHVSHQNIVPFMGIHFYKGTRMCIISPWMHHGDLTQFLLNNPDTPRLPLLFDVICGIKYLHETKVIHADIKAQNILVSENGRAMVADFGISRVDLTDRTSNQWISGTLRWTAPELLGQNARPTTESDIWSFACLCYEVFTGKAPFYEFHGLGVISVIMTDGTTPSRPESNLIHDDVWKLLVQCWDRNPKKRPTAEEIVRFFEEKLNILDNRGERDSHWSTIQLRRPIVKYNYERVSKLLQEILAQAVSEEHEVGAEEVV